MEKIEYKGYTIEIEQDTDTESPRTAWDNLGTIAAFHRRYDLGDKHNFDNPQEVMQYIKENDCIYLNVYMYEHSGIALSTSNAVYPFNCQFDSGQLGVIFIERDKLLKEFDAKKITKALEQKAIDILKSEINTYNQYLSGDVYFFNITKPNVCKCCNVDTPIDVDSCGDYYGYDECLNEAKHIVDNCDKK
jgi:hypothetical protein